MYSPVYFKYPELFDHYYGDYTEVITNYCYVYDHPERPLSIFIKNTFNQGYYDRCYEACRFVWTSFVNDKCRLTTEQIQQLCYFKTMSKLYLKRRVISPSTITVPVSPLVRSSRIYSANPTGHKCPSRFSISVIIPVYPPHFRYLEGLINNINAQTCRPKEVIIALSECTNELNLQIFDKLKMIKSSEYHLITLPTLDRCTAGVNRNRGAMMATGDYLMFLDADDIYHQQKVEITMNVIGRYQPNLILHNYYRSREKNLLDQLEGDTLYPLEEVPSTPEHITWFHDDLTLRERTFGKKRNREKEIKELATCLGSDMDIAHGIITVKKKGLGSN